MVPGAAAAGRWRHFPGKIGYRSPAFPRMTRLAVDTPRHRFILVAILAVLVVADAEPGQASVHAGDLDRVSRPSLGSQPQVLQFDHAGGRAAQADAVLDVPQPAGHRQRRHIVNSRTGDGSDRAEVVEGEITKRDFSPTRGRLWALGDRRPVAGPVSKWDVQRLGAACHPRRSGPADVEIVATHKAVRVVVGKEGVQDVLVGGGQSPLEYGAHSAPSVVSPVEPLGRMAPPAAPSCSRWRQGSGAPPNEHNLTSGWVAACTVRAHRPDRKRMIHPAQ